MIKLFHKSTSKWTLTAVVIFISLGWVGFTNSISNATPETGAIVNSNSMALATKPTEVENNKLTRNFDSIPAIDDILPDQSTNKLAQEYENIS